FNEDRVKSRNAEASYRVPEGLPAAKPRAYLVCFGASAFQDPAWDLRYPAADARLAVRALADGLCAAGRYEVVPVLLVSERGRGRVPGPASAPKATLQAVLAALPGEPVPEKLKVQVSGTAKLRRATPDDLVVLFASSHGYTDDRGTFHLLPSDIGPARGLGR